MRDVKIPNWLKGLPLAPEFRPTDTEFADPIAYISKIEKEASAFGICKIIPPLPKPSKKYVYSNLNKSLLKCPELGLEANLENGKNQAVFTTRHQELGQNAKRNKGSVHKQVWQSGEVYTVEQFESKSKNFSRSQLGMVKEVSPLVVEAMFWKASSEKPISVEYANDVPGSGFGEPEGSYRYFRRIRRTRKRSTFNKGATTNGDPNPSVIMCSDKKSRQVSSETANEMEGSAGWKLANSPWNLQVIARSAGSLTRFMPDDIPGVTSPMVYIGMLFSWFAWHVEDHELHSLNFLHTGSQKTWYAVPEDYAFDFEEVIREHAYGGNIDRLAALTFLGEKTTLLSPEVIVALGIPCCRLVQNPGEFVVTFPRAYHVGFSHGFSCGEAANFCTPKWLNVAKEAAVRRAAMNYLPMLSHQQLLYLLTMSFISRVPRSLLPGARSSRLRDRQKEEREISVKKAFIEDIINENNLLATLFSKSSSYRAVLWDLESLPSPSKETELCNSVATIDTTPKEDACSENNSNQDLYTQMSVCMETVNDLYVDDNDDDLSYDFQVDSGTLVCVACGILGFPFMSVVQPSEKASMNLLPSDQEQPVGGSVSDGQNDPSKSLEGKMTQSIGSPVLEPSLPPKDPPAALGVECDKGWNSSSQFLRPRIFCLEHAIKIEELLCSKGGANMLVLCHSDFQKMKAQASAIAEEIGSAFNYKEIPLENASEDDLNLINLAIDDEERDRRGEDWTSKLGINLQHCVKVRKDSSSMQVQHALKLGGLFLDTTPVTNPSSLNLNWQSRKFRSKRNLKHGVQLKPNEKIQIKKIRQEEKIIQYSRRTFKSKPRKHLLEEVSAANCGDSDKNSRNMSGNNLCNTEIFRNSSSELVVLASPGKSESLHGSVLIATSKDPSMNSDPYEIVETENTEIETRNMQEMIMDGGKSCDSTIQSNSELRNETKVAEENDDKEERCYGEESACSPVAIESTETSESRRENQSMEEKNEACDLEIKDVSYSACSSTTHPVVESSRAVSVTLDYEKTPDNRVHQEIENVDRSNENEPMSSNLTPILESSPVLAEEKFEVSRETTTHAADKMQSRSKRKREPELEMEDQSNLCGFIKSPCEGLRSRAEKNASKSKMVEEEKEAAKQKVKPSEKTWPRMGKRKNDSTNLKKNLEKSHHRCDLEGCQMSFKTKTELALHKRNKCPHEGCGKKFRTHKYAILHERVHGNDRPLECPWKGCGMSFKWAWARTEHIRLHTGERPYECKFEDCGLTFRFISDYSRHRRKFGHYVT